MKIIRTLAIIIIGVAVAFYGIIAVLNGVYINASRWYYNVKDFDIYYKDFQTLVDVAKRYESETEKSNEHFLLAEYKKGVLYLNYQGKRINLSEEEFKSLNNIPKAFQCKDALFYGIGIYKNRISFNIHGSHYYALVYSADNSKPTYVNTPDENDDVFVKKVRDNWYHVVKDTG